MKVLIVSLVMIAVILVFAFSVLAQSSTPSNPFLPYADLLAKRPTLERLENGNFSCEFVLLEATQKCSLTPEDHYFSKIIVTVTEGVPNDISFQVSPDSLRVGDLATLWGKPDTLFPHSAPRLLWTEEEDGIIRSAHVPSADRLNYLAPVWVVSFTF